MLEAGVGYWVHYRRGASVATVGAVRSGADKIGFSRAGFLQAGASGLSWQAVRMLEIPNDGRERGHFGSPGTPGGFDEFELSDDEVGQSRRCSADTVRIVASNARAGRVAAAFERAER